MTDAWSTGGQGRGGGGAVGAHQVDPVVAAPVCYVDILVRPALDNASRLLVALEAFGFPIAELSPEAMADRSRMLQMGVPPVQMHVMNAVSGVEWDEAWADRVEGLSAPTWFSTWAATPTCGTSGRPVVPRTSPTATRSSPVAMCSPGARWDALDGRIPRRCSHGREWELHPDGTRTFEWEYCAPK